MKHIVIAGGGFAGIVSARHLAQHKDIKITLVSDSDSFKYCPSLYRVATGHLRRQAFIPIADLVGDFPNITFIKARVEKIDRTARTLTTDSKQKLSYDYAILGLGVITSYFNIPGLDRYSYGIKSSDDLERLHTHLHDKLTAAKKAETNYVIVGGGPTGVELAAGLHDYLQTIAKRHHLSRSHITISLVEAAPRLLPTFDERASKKVFKRLSSLGIDIRLNSKVEAETAKSLHVNGQSIPTHTVIWTAGVTNNPFYKLNADQFTLSPRGKVVVDDYLRVDKHTYVVGDNAEVKFSGLAESAVIHGKFVAEDIIMRMHGIKVKKYVPKQPIYVVPAGRDWAIMQWHKLVLSGYLVGWVRRFADLIGYRDMMGLWQAIRIWTTTDYVQETCELCQANEARTKRSKRATLERA